MTLLLPVIDWDLVARLGHRFTSSTPFGIEELSRAAVDLRADAVQAAELVAGAAGLGKPVRPKVYAVDRPTWLEANAQLVRAIFERIEPPPKLNLTRKVGRRANAVLVAGGLGLAGNRIVGQFDPFNEGGRVIFVVSNVLRIERAYRLDQQEFRLWVALHEQVHAMQFQAAPWLGDHLVSLIRRVVADRRVRWVGKLVPGHPGDGERALDQIMAMMSFLEGHADVMSDLAATGVLATLATLRATFDRDRTGKRSPILERMGVVTKAEQYTRGAGFCRSVLALAGVETLNRVFEGAHLLPELAELAEPTTWLERVDGQA